MTLNDIWQKYLEAVKVKEEAAEAYRYSGDTDWLIRFEHYKGREEAFLEIYNQLKKEENETQTYSSEYSPKGLVEI